MKITEDKALYKIAAYCSKAERSEYDVKRKLQNWELEDDSVSRIILRLTKENFLNEDRYCRAYVKDKITFSRWGKAKIVFELKKKYISEAIIQSAFDELENHVFDEPLMKVLSTKIKSIKGKDEYEKQTKLIRFALGRGYTFEQIKRCLSKLTNTDDNDEYFELFS